MPILQSCRPFSGAVSYSNTIGVTWGRVAFNRAAPFRERLAVHRAVIAAVDNPSIVPPPFGSG